MSKIKLPLRTRIALEIARQQRMILKKEHPLRQLFWECTWRCNLRCKHCGSDCKNVSTIPDMPAEDFLAAVDKITPHVDNHRLNVIITGGEPLMRKDLETVGLELYRREYPWGIVTNGFMLTPERFQSLRAAGLHAITISIDGFEDDHNWMRGHKESFAWAVRAIKLVASAPDLVWDVVTCVNQKNYPYLSEFKEFLYSIGVRNWRLFSIFPAGRAAEHPEFKLKPEQYKGLLDFIKETRAEGKVKASYCCEDFVGEYEGEVRDNFFMCQAGIVTGSILIDGSIGACPSIRSNYSQGNIYEDDFMEVWNNRYQPYRDREWMRRDECASCKYFRYCEGNGMHLRDNDGKLMLCRLNDLAY